MENSSSSLRLTSLSSPNFYFASPAQTDVQGIAAASPIPSISAISPTTVESAAQQALAMLQLSPAAAANTSSSRASLSPNSLEDARIAILEAERFGRRNRTERPQSAHPGHAQARRQHARHMSVTLGGGQQHPTHAPLDFRRGTHSTGNHPTHTLINFGPQTASHSTSASPSHNAVSPAPFMPHIVSSYTVERHNVQSPPPIVAFVRGLPQGARIEVSTLPTDLASATGGTHFVIETAASSGHPTPSQFFSSEDEGDEMFYHERTPATPASHASPAPEKPEGDSQV